MLINTAAVARPPSPPTYSQLPRLYPSGVTGRGAPHSALAISVLATHPDRFPIDCGSRHVRSHHIGRPPRLRDGAVLDRPRSEVGDVAELAFADVDLSAGVLRLGAGKPRRERILPLPDRVQRALHDYIRRGRPPTLDGLLYVRHSLPVGAVVRRELIRGVLRRAYAAVPGVNG
jgi:integrase